MCERRDVHENDLESIPDNDFAQSNGIGVESGVDPNLSAAIDAAIAAGIKQGQARKAHKRIRIRRSIGGAVAACMLLLACAFTIRVSPVFASLVRDIPGFEKFVDLIRHTQDQGIGLALDNDFVQTVGASAEQDGVKLTIQGIIADDTRMVMFYDIQSLDEESDLQIRRLSLTDAAGQPLQASVGFNYPDEVLQDDVETTGVQRGTADFNLVADQVFPEQVVLQTQVILKTHSSRHEPQKLQVGHSYRDSGQVDSAAVEIAFQIPFRIDTARFEGLRRQYDLHRTIEMEGQKITFVKAVVSPLRVSLHLAYDAANSKQIFGPGDIRLIDERGTQWKHYLGNMAKDQPVLHFESPYFNEPEALYIEGNWFRALDRDRMEVIVDTDKGLVLQSPDDKLSLHAVHSGSDTTILDFVLLNENEDDNMLYSLFERSFTDAEGRMFERTSREEASMTSSFETGKPGILHVYYYLDKADYKQPLTFRVSNYPQFIRQPYRIQVK